MQNEEFCCGKGCAQSPLQEPIPLYGAMSASEPIPWHALGPLAEPIRAIETLAQAPAAIAMQSVLAVVSTIVQGLGDVETLHGRCPSSFFALTVAKSGERKSTCDKLATAALRRFDQLQNRQYLRDKAAFEAKLHESRGRQRHRLNKELDVIDDLREAPAENLAPEPPLVPTMLVSDATVEGLCRRLEIGTPSIAVMTDEGGQFFGGHGMKRENAPKTAATFSKFGDGDSVVRSRASSDLVPLHGKRVSMHLMIQPGIAVSAIGDPMLKDQGLLSRIAIAWPDSQIGSRLISQDPSRLAEEDRAKAVLAIYDRRNETLLNIDLPLHANSRTDLDPPCLLLSDPARSKLVDFYNDVELSSSDGGAFEYMKGFAAKAPEIAARIACVLTLYADEKATEISEEAAQSGIDLMTWYLMEMRRIAVTGRPNEELLSAEALRVWLVHRWTGEFIDKRTMVRRGPGHLRDGNTIEACIQKLVAHRWLVPGTGSQVIDGVTSWSFWQIVRSGASR